MNDDVEEFYSNSIPNKLRCTSWFKKEVSSGGFRYSFGIGFVDFVVQNLSGRWMDPILILYQSAPLKLVFFVQVLKKIALPCGAS